MKANLADTRTAVKAAYQDTHEDAPEDALIIRKGAPIVYDANLAKKNGHRQSKKAKFKRIGMYAQDKYFSCELLGNDRQVNRIHFTIYAEGGQMAKSLAAICQIIKHCRPEWDDHDWLIDTAVKLPAMPPGGMVEPVVRDTIELRKMALNGVPVLFVGVG